VNITALLCSPAGAQCSAQVVVDNVNNAKKALGAAGFPYTEGTLEQFEMNNKPPFQFLFSLGRMTQVSQGTRETHADANEIRIVARTIAPEHQNFAGGIANQQEFLTLEDMIDETQAQTDAAFDPWNLARGADTRLVSVRRRRDFLPELPNFMERADRQVWLFESTFDVVWVIEVH
jgi:hypothetical protein